jgi:hypothetical protein
MPERAEIEAVAEVLEGATSMFPNPHHAARYYAEKAIVALERVRDARGDDEACFDEAGRRRYPKMLHGEAATAARHAEHARGDDACPVCGGSGVRVGDYGAEADGWCDSCEGTGKAARSPQSEDHEAGIEAAAQALIRLHSVFEPSDNNFAWVTARHAVAAYLSRVSPSRDGTVAVEDVVEWLDVRAKAYRAAEFAVDDAVALALRSAAGAFVAEFGSARAGESKQTADGG